MNFKRFNGSTWETVQHKIYGSGTDSLTAFPAVIQASGEALTDYTIYGNTLQNGTPTPEAPVDVVGCGEKTGNLAYGRIENANISSDGMIARLNGYDIAIGRVESGIVYTANTYVYAFYTNEPTSIGDVSYDGSRIVGTEGEPSTFTAPITGYVAFRIDSGEQAMLSLGSTALPYEPYGYKLPITVNGTEYPIYLGQVSTTRRIKKLVLTGEEGWSEQKTNTFRVHDLINDCLAPSTGSNGISNAFVQANYNQIISLSDGQFCYGKPTGTYSRVAFKNTDCATVDDWKNYLAAQYANGTPVTIWCVLTNPETGIVNEPLHKIGDYADTISFAQAGVTIPTSDGDNTLTFGTTVQPSAMSATFKGWHPVQAAKVYDGNDWS